MSNVRHKAHGPQNILKEETSPQGDMSSQEEFLADYEIALSKPANMKVQQ